MRQAANGRTMRLWDDVWCGNGTLREALRGWVSVQDEGLMVADIFYSGQWRLDRISTIFLTDELNCILSSPVVLFEEIEDGWVWNGILLVFFQLNIRTLPAASRRLYLILRFVGYGSCMPRKRLDFWSGLV